MILNGVPQKKQVLKRPFPQKPVPRPVQNPSLNKLGLPKNQSFNELKDKIISYIRINGPVIPIQISKAFGGDTMFAGAVLSELISNRVLKITSAKIGGSPVYFMPGQEEKLELLREHLGRVPKQAYDILKEKKVVRESECEPWLRVALKEITDFASPITVRHDDGSEEVFWRWHLLPEDEAKQRITMIVTGKQEPIKPAPEPIKPVPEPIKPEKPDVEDPRKKEEQKTLETKAEKPKKPKKEKVDVFKNELLAFLQQKGLEVLEEVQMKKGEYGFVVKLESSLGKLSCLAVAKKKKKLTDNDVLLSYSVAQHHKLPLVLIGKELSKKAEAVIEKDARGVVFIKL